MIYFVTKKLEHSFKQECSVIIVKLGQIQDITSKIVSDIILKPRSF